jgi:hypothetical protein
LQCNLLLLLFGVISLKPKKPNQTQTKQNRKKNRAKPEKKPSQIRAKMKKPSQTGKIFFY